MHWLQFRGANDLGIAPENADPPIHFSADTNLLWKTEILPGWSSPCIVNDKIFLTGYNRTDTMLHTFAMNRENGALLWKDSVRLRRAYRLHPVNTYANPTIASNGAQIFSHFPGYGLIAYDLDGQRMWEYKHRPIAARTGGASSPVIVDNMVIINLNRMKDPRIQALDCDTGDTLWAIRDPDHIHNLPGSSASPVIYKDLIIMHQSMEIVAYNISDQTTEWWLNTPTTAVVTPVILDDVLYTSTWVHLGEKNLQASGLDFEYFLERFDSNGNRKIEKGEVPDSLLVSQRPESRNAESSSISFNRLYSAYDKNKDGAMDVEDWDYFLEIAGPYTENHGMLAIPLSGSGERPYRDVLWKINEDSPETPSPLVVGDYVFFIKSGGIITVVNRKTGDVFKKGRIGAAGTYISSPMLAANNIYTCAYNGTVTVLSADDFSVVAHNKLKEKIGASPVAVDDVLYVRTDKHLYAFRDQ
jgi:outer membrane protein assembly factor BamB